MNSSKYNGITEGVIWKQLMLFFLPVLLGTFFQQLYNTVDAVIVGRFVGKEALAAVGGSSSQILNLLIGFFTGVTSGAAVIVAQYYGARDAGGFLALGAHGDDPRHRVRRHNDRCWYPHSACAAAHHGNA